jgi:DNA-binding transcriptional LysR family regulator
MDKLHAIQVFLEVARGKSFTSAAQRLGVSRASVTKQIFALEALLGARLLNRSTQHVALTESGLALFSRGSMLVRQFQEIEEELGRTTHEARGTLRVGAPSYYGATHLVPAILAFQHQHPEVQVALHLDIGDRNLIKEGLDLSIRIATSLQGSNEISRLLVRSPQVLVAAPSYLDTFGRPTSPEQLAHHNCLVHTIKSPTNLWQFNDGGRRLSVQVDGPLKANFGEALKAAALLGKGISMHPTYMVEEDILAGRLEVVLANVEVIGVELYAIYSYKENLPVRVRSFIDFLKTYVTEDPKYRPSTPSPEMDPRSGIA